MALPAFELQSLCFILSFSQLVSQLMTRINKSHPHTGLHAGFPDPSLVCPTIHDGELACTIVSAG